MKTPDKTNVDIKEFFTAYGRMSEGQKRKVNYLLAWYTAGAYFKHPSRRQLQLLWLIVAGLIWPDLAPVIVPVLAVLCAVLAYAAIGGRVTLVGELVQALAAAGCLAGAMAGRTVGIK